MFVFVFSKQNIVADFGMTKFIFILDFFFFVNVTLENFLTIIHFFSYLRNIFLISQNF